MRLLCNGWSRLFFFLSFLSFFGGGGCSWHAKKIKGETDLFVSPGWINDRFISEFTRQIKAPVFYPVMFWLPGKLRRGSSCNVI